MKESDISCCPKCKSSSLLKKEGKFDKKKAIIGAGATGGLGIILGHSKKNKVQVTCQECGYRFWVKKDKDKSR